jgi:hypothetical protein
MDMEISIHDNIIYGYLVKCDDLTSPVYKLTLFTEYHGPEDQTEYVDVVFSNVVTHQFESVTSRTVLFDIEETSPLQVYEQNLELFKRLKDYGWPFLYKDRENLFRILGEMKMRAFLLHSSCGLEGWVWSGNMELIARSERKRFEE